MLSTRIDTLGLMGYKYKGIVLWKSHLGISLVLSLDCQCTRLTINLVGIHLDCDIFAWSWKKSRMNYINFFRIWIVHQFSNNGMSKRHECLKFGDVYIMKYIPNNIYFPYPIPQNIHQIWAICFHFLYLGRSCQLHFTCVWTKFQLLFIHCKYICEIAVLM